MLSSSRFRSALHPIGIFFNNKKVVYCTYFLLALIVTLKQYHNHSFNNYLIFKYCYVHAVNHLNLYTTYAEYNDSSHYGPFFSLLIAPFALLPDFIGMLLWQFTNTAFLLWAITKLPLKENQTIAVLWICAHELLTALFSFQVNPGITAMIILSYVFIREKKDLWAALMIMLGTFIKLYGIVGLAFFFFSKQKPKFIMYSVLWAVAFFVLPMFFFSPDYILNMYGEWYYSLSKKNMLNASLTSYQDISVMGMARRMLQNISIPNLPFIVVGLLIFLLPYARIRQYKHTGFQCMLLASTLLFPVLFSTGSESPTYIIAFAGVAIWFIIQPKKTSWQIFLFCLAIVLTSLSPSDLFPKYLRDNYVKYYALKALPCLLIWLTLIFEMIKNDFSKYPITLNTAEHE